MRRLQASLSGERITTALFYSLIESAKLVGVEPRAYLGDLSGISDASAT